MQAICITVFVFSSILLSSLAIAFARPWNGGSDGDDHHRVGFQLVATVVGMSIVVATFAVSITAKISEEEGAPALVHKDAFPCNDLILNRRVQPHQLQKLLSNPTVLPTPNHVKRNKGRIFGEDRT